jgi:hypothetical protein
MHRAWVFKRFWRVRLHDLEDEYAVFVDQTAVMQAALEGREAFRPHRRCGLLRRFGREPEALELVDVAARPVADISPWS